MIVFEFFSGIGGMHQALTNIKETEIKKIFPFDINHNANITYLHNFGVKPFELSIESFSLEEYEKLCKSENTSNNIIRTMSPPCQPFTRQGNIKDLEDVRSKGFMHLMNILSKTTFKPKFFLLENVKGFEVL
jgi:tRNA (cytosine38-C5)-methyltransferase